MIFIGILFVSLSYFWPAIGIKRKKQATALKKARNAADRLNAQIPLGRAEPISSRKCSAVGEGKTWH